MQINKCHHFPALAVDSFFPQGHSHHEMKLLSIGRIYRICDDQNWKILPEWDDQEAGWTPSNPVICSQTVMFGVLMFVSANLQIIIFHRPLGLPINH